MIIMSRWLALLMLVAVVAADGDVIDLDSDSFQDGIAGHDTILVEFYAPWCGHCKRLAPEYEKAATELAKADPPIPLAKVDCPANNAVCSEFGVTGYPTLKIFRNGAFSADYQGPRSADGIVTYMKKQAGPSARELTTAEQVKAFLANEEHSIVGFFSDASSKLLKTLKTVSNSLRDDFRFGYVTSKEVTDEASLEYDDQVVIFQPPQVHTKMEETRLVYDGEGDLKEFIETNFMGLAGVRTTDNMKYFEAKKPLAVAYFDVDYVRNPKGSNYWRNRVIKVAKQFVGQVSFAVSDKSTFNREMSDLSLSTTDDITVGLYDSKGKYPMTETFSVDNLKSFIQQYLDGELEPFMKSEPVPEDNDGPVTVVVGKNFDEVVNDDSKDVLIEFYAPWCGHCKQLAPKYEELGEKFQDDPSIVIAKMDATANDYPPIYDVRGFPTIYWVPAGSKDKPQQYSGGREVNDFVEYIKKMATNPPVVAGEEEKKKKKGKKEEL